MRCFLMNRGHIVGVEFLSKGPDDKLVEEARAHFDRRIGGGERFDGFEVWDRARRVYVWPEETMPPEPA